MATQPAKPASPPPHKPSQTQSHPPQPQPKPQTPPKLPEAGVAPPERNLPIGARPRDDRDPQSEKFEAQAGPPHWQEPERDAEPQRQEWTPEPALDPLAQEPPENYYADGMSAPEGQRARAAWVEQHGMADYLEEIDERPDDERPKYEANVLAAGGGAFTSAANTKQVPGVAPPAKRS